MEALSSMAAEEFKQVDYKGTLWIQFCPEIEQVEHVYDRLWQYRQEHPKDLLFSKCPLEYRKIDYGNYDWETESFRVIVSDCLPPALWPGLCMWALRMDATQLSQKPIQWANLSPKKVRALADALVGCPVTFDGRSNSIDYFANTGGISLSQVDTNQFLESRLVPGLFLCGQVLDGHGSTAGYSRMRDWLTGRIAGTAAAKSVSCLTDTAVVPSTSDTAVGSNSSMT